MTSKITVAASEVRVNDHIYNGTGSALEVLIDVNGFYQPHSHGPQPAFSQ